MEDQLDAAIARAIESLREDGFEPSYIDAAVRAYRENIQHERQRAEESGARTAISPISKITSVTSVDDPAPKESIGWQFRFMQKDEIPPEEWIVIHE